MLVSYIHVPKNYAHLCKLLVSFNIQIKTNRYNRIKISITQNRIKTSSFSNTSIYHQVYTRRYIIKYIYI
jgi:hypothetical protein